MPESLEAGSTSIYPSEELRINLILDEIFVVLMSYNHYIRLRGFKGVGFIELIDKLSIFAYVFCISNWMYLKLSLSTNIFL